MSLAKAVLLVIILSTAFASAQSTGQVPSLSRVANADFQFEIANTQLEIAPGELTPRSPGLNSASLRNASPLKTEFSSSKPDRNFLNSEADLLVVASPSQEKVDLGGLLKGSLTFLTVEHGFRLLTEQSTREQMVSQPFFVSYAEAVGNLHGWSDGDEFYVNWVGHPMQGAVAGYLWQTNDRAYKDVEFGRDRRYWKSKLRGGAFSYFYSVQFEIGPISEASIGFIQANPPEMGFVDHAVTPAMGLAWTIGEDFIDRDVIQRFESRVANPYLRILLRGGLNPSRSFANVMSGKVPWHRDDRPGAFAKAEMAAYRPLVKKTERDRIKPPGGVAPFEFHLSASVREYLGRNKGGNCVGGAGSALFRINPEWQVIGEVGGCKMSGLGQDITGDALDYLVGPRWTPQGESKWSPHFEVMVGGTKVTQEYVNRNLEAELVEAAKNAGSDPPAYTSYTTWNDSNGFSVRAGAGMTYKINSALAVQVADFRYQHSWTDPIGGSNYRNSLQLTGGLILKMGTW